MGSVYYNIEDEEEMSSFNIGDKVQIGGDMTEVVVFRDDRYLILKKLEHCEKPYFIVDLEQWLIEVGSYV